MSSEIIGWQTKKAVLASGQRASVWLLLRLVFSVNSALMNDDKTTVPKSKLEFHSAALLFLLTFTSLDMQSCSKRKQKTMSSPAHRVYSTEWKWMNLFWSRCSGFSCQVPTTFCVCSKSSTSIRREFSYGSVWTIKGSVKSVFSNLLLLISACCRQYHESECNLVCCAQSTKGFTRK